MNKKQAKHIREIAERLPVVLQQSMSGFTIEEDKMVPYVYNVEINHERRLRKAYERNGLDGIKSYLEMISNLQKQRHENFVQQKSSDNGQGAGSHNDDGSSVEILEDDKSDFNIMDQTEGSVGA